MKKLPAGIKFRYPWRSYQKRILDASKRHLRDKHLHVVAAPGSGKTVLGLQMVVNLDRPALVFTPSLGIRDQWIRRFCDLFLQVDHPPSWISTDLKNPGFLTITTYQSLGATMKKEGETSLLKVLNDKGIETLLFDEAHHLRNYWWECLMAMKDGLNRLITISLTATPPYDVSQVEWNRYMALCGEVDEEVSIAELVKVKNLCHHQDYVYFCSPNSKEQNEVAEFQSRVESFLSDLALDQELVSAIQKWPPLKEAEGSVDVLSKCNEFALSVAVFLGFAHGVVPKNFLGVMGLEEIELPKLNTGWAEVLLNGLLYEVPYFPTEHKGLCKRLLAELQSFNAIHQKRVLLRTTPHHAKILRSSLTKLQSIADIIDIERDEMKELLRMVVLTDYICLHDFPTPGKPDRELSRMGVVPIFEYLRKLRLAGLSIGVLTGKLVVLSSGVNPFLDTLAERKGIDPTSLVRKPLPHDDAYFSLSIKGSSDSRLVELVTDLFQEGFIQVLIGTTALLGEGWDAPAINSLVLATVVGSYVSTNQIRGRAIRTFSLDPDKTANIWHLACVHAGRIIGRDEEASPRLMDDIDLLERRFGTFTGLSVTRRAIENGLARMDLGEIEVENLNTSTWNAQTVARARNRYDMAKCWQEVFDHLDELPGEQFCRPCEEIFVPKGRIPAQPIVRLLLKSRNPFFAWLRSFQQVRMVKRTAWMLYAALGEEGFVSCDGSISVTRGTRDVLARLQGVPRREETIFTAALSEIYNPLQKPRYLIRMGDECYPVPQLLATNKRLASDFHARWRRRVGRGALVYSLSKEGRALLLQARQKHLATRHQDVVRSVKVVS
ncbi:MAG: DEAD/DEAH box helicase family protein [Akkermansiaceae bacterium]|nr:DEAD/DEAH box helicase family protein [Akkermansiaceae bacterium]